MSNYIQTNYVVAIPDAATYTVLPSDSGKTLLIPILGQVLAITLPVPQMGLRYRFMAVGILANAATITPSIANTMTGSLLNILPGAAGIPAIVRVGKSASPTVQFTATATIGDYVDLNCNGNIWYVSGLSFVAAGLA